MPKVALTHFEAAILFAFLASTVLGIVTKKSDRERFHYFLYCFAYFIVATIVLAWLMYFGHR